MFLLDRFQDFYREVLRLKQSVGQGNWVFDGQAQPGQPPVEDLSPTAVWRTLLALLERQALDASRSGGDFALEVYRRAQYAMAALADEVFLHLDWPGREAWRSNLLESRLFSSHRAGEELFERIEELLHDRDNVYSELARVYLTVLALGFQGKYRGHPEAARELESYRRRLFRFIFGRDPQAVRGDERLVPEAYGATLDEGSGSTLPHLKPWVWALIVLVALWLGGGHLIWRSTLDGLQPLVTEILGAEGGKRAQPAVPVENGGQVR
ncbi:MAG TPA: DotU family type IV/VI secretion system protein [Thermoanaerobaculia bacterium]|jgi:type VI secretion system protein ImpK|nr:DotU family type IV/VI secretion system protein [Thermoanaerobaculia bacterium]